jgi:hypothetical protein
MDAQDLAALEALVVDNPELEALETKLARFNLFEASGLVRHEIRHSNFLAFLLDPSQPHGLGDTFLKWLLQETLGREEAKLLHSLSPLDLHLKGLSGSVVRREWRNIDILIENEDLKLIVAIENKIGIGEHSNQLLRYREMLHREFPHAEHIVLILLSPEGTAPSDENYLAIGYETVHALLAKILTRLASRLSPDIELVLRHYKELLATHVIDDPELDRLCDDIYRKHRRALDLIFERRKSPRLRLLETAIDWIRSNADKVFPDNVHKDMVKFVPRTWNAFSPIIGEKDGEPLRSLCVLIRIEPNRAQLWIEMHRGPAEYRSRMQMVVDENRQTFPPKAVRRHDVNSVFYREEILTDREFASLDPDELGERLVVALDTFLADNIPLITRALEKAVIGTPQEMAD